MHSFSFKKFKYLDESNLYFNDGSACLIGRKFSYYTKYFAKWCVDSEKEVLALCVFHLENILYTI